MIKEPSTHGRRAPYIPRSRAYLPKTEDKESEQKQPPQDTANEDPQGDEDRAGLNHLQQALYGGRAVWCLYPFSQLASPHVRGVSRSLEIEE